MVSLCFGFDSRCFLFFLCLTLLGKPAVLISDIDVSRAPWSLWVNRLTEKFPNFILICTEIQQNTISYCCRIIQSKHLHSLHFQRPAALGPEWPLGVPPLSCKTQTNSDDDEKALMRLESLIKG